MYITYLKDNPMFKARKINNHVHMRTSITQAFTILYSVHSFKCEAIKPINRLNLSPLILIHKLFQALQFPTLMLWNLWKDNPKDSEKDQTVS